jgi:hypothetical protein
MIEQFSRAMIEAVVQAKNIEYHTDIDGDISIELAEEATYGYRLTAHCLAVGPAQSIYCVRVVANKAIPQLEWGRAILLCNSWNRDHRWPKAYLHYASMESAVGEIILEGQLDLERGVIHEQMVDFTDGQIACALQFWAWAHQQHGL